MDWFIRGCLYSATNNRHDGPEFIVKNVCLSRLNLMSTCKVQVKRVHYWDEIHGNREEYIHGRKCEQRI